jgi:ABC-2 type transport system permease protein
MHAFFALLRKDLILHFSNRRAVIMSLVAPILIAAFFGSLFGGGGGKDGDKPSRIPVVVVDLDHSDVSQRVLANLRGDSALAVSEASSSEARAQVLAGKQRAALTLPAGFGAQAKSALVGGAGGTGSKPQVQVLYDPSQAMVLPLVRGLLAQHAVQAVAAGMGGPRMELPFATREEAAVSELGAKYNSYAHSFAGMGVQFILLMGVDMGVGLLLLRRMGLWQRLRAAPLSRAQLLGSRIASCALIALIVFGLVYAVAIAGFGVRISGSVPGFIAVLLAFSALTASFGLMIAAIGRTPDATRGLAILATLLLVMLGGAWVPSFIFPPWLQQVSLWMPTHWAIEGLDGMTWRGLPLSAAVAPVAAMLGFTAVFAGIALWRFRWEE